MARLPTGHQTALDTALPGLIEFLSVVFMVPRVLLGRLPGKKFKDAHLSFTEITKYLEEFWAGVLSNVEAVAAKKNKTILGGPAISPTRKSIVTNSQCEIIRGRCSFGS
jgi:hypothetical protein